jgi:hypothetical protein
MPDNAGEETMRKRLGVFAAALAVTIVAGATAAYAQGAVVSEVPFAFKLGNKTFEPGTYTFRPDDQNAVITITSPKWASSPAIVETRLGEPDPSLADGRLVFDKVGQVYYLSELWLPGAEDGFLLHITKEPHTHVNVKLGRKG